MNHPNLKQAQDCLNNVPPERSKVSANHYPELVNRLHVQVRIKGNFGRKGGIPWHAVTEGATCVVCKQAVETVKHFLLDCPGFKGNFDTLWEKFETKVRELNPIDGDQNVNFITNLDQHHKMLLLLGSLQLPFDNTAIYSINRFIADPIGKTYKIRTEKLRELRAKWLTT